jgi:hypothetical protein
MSTGNRRSPAGAVGGIGWGILAGAAGATALNLVTYVDQAVRARPATDTPGQTVEALTSAVGVDVPGDPEKRANRLEGLGPLAGLAVGLGVGAVAGAVATTGRWSWMVATPAIGLGAMAISDATMTALKISDPRTWTPASVASDAGPHLAYGAVTAILLNRLLRAHA